ncbi:fpr2 [Scenedesmus sp. PABB004]|nr:fpr2 [Scenedesmus sp. PABB004]
MSPTPALLEPGSFAEAWHAYARLAAREVCVPGLPLGTKMQLHPSLSAGGQASQAQPSTGGRHSAEPGAQPTCGMCCAVRPQSPAGVQHLLRGRASPVRAALQECWADAARQLKDDGGAAAGQPPSGGGAPPPVGPAAGGTWPCPRGQDQGKLLATLEALDVAAERLRMQLAASVARSPPDGGDKPGAATRRRAARPSSAAGGGGGGGGGGARSPSPASARRHWVPPSVARAAPATAEPHPVIKEDAQPSRRQLLAAAVVAAAALPAARRAAAEQGGIQIVADTPGFGQHAVAQGDIVLAHYVGTLDATGEVFDSTRGGDGLRYRDGGRGVLRPAALRVGGGPVPGVCPGLEAALLGMKIGGHRTVLVPPELGFGASDVLGPYAGVPGGSTLRYELELLRVSARGPDAMMAGLSQCSAGGASASTANCAVIEPAEFI